MTQTRKRPGSTAPGTIQSLELTDESKFASHDSGQLRQMSADERAEYERLERKRLDYLARADRPETYDEQLARLKAQAEPAVNDALEQRRAELIKIDQHRGNLRSRAELRDRVEDLRKNRPGYEACPQSANDYTSIRIRKYEDGTNEADFAKPRCKSSSCAHCGPWWLADWLDKVDDAIDMTLEDFHVTIARNADDRSKITRRLADRHRNHDDDYAALSVPCLDDRFLIISTMPTPTSTPAAYDEALALARNAFELIHMTALELGQHPTTGRNPRFVGRWRPLTNEFSNRSKKGTIREERTYFASSTTFWDKAVKLADEFGGRRQANPSASVDLSISSIADVDGFEARLRAIGAVSTEDQKRRRQERAAIRQIEDLEVTNGRV